MICCLCLTSSFRNLNISNQQDHLHLRMVISKYFWFEPNTTDSICENCWKEIDSFHQFYKKIQEIHSCASPPAPKTELVIIKNKDNDEEVKVKTETEIEIDNQSNEDVSETEDVQYPETIIKNTTETEDFELSLRKTKPLQITSTSVEDNKKSKSEYTRISELADTKITSFMQLCCELCSCHFYKFADVKAHYRNNHEQKGYVTCCDKKFFKRFNLIDHIERHLNPNNFKCPHCGKVLVNNLGLRKHILTIHEIEKTFDCEECAKSFGSAVSLKRHKLMHVPIELCKWNCNECDKSFPSNFLLNAHKRRNHDMSAANVCHICGKVSRNNHDFKTHQQTHCNVEETKVKCELCGVWSKNPQSLRVHMRMIHSAGNETVNGHRCNICDKILLTKRSLKSHRHHSHASTGKFNCTICEKSFKRAIALKEHLTIHTGEVLYNCTLCAKTFKSNANYHHHRKKEHRLEWEEQRKNRGLPILETDTR